jgi:nucleoside-diphosphate-sugar epimerase
VAAIGLITGASGLIGRHVMEQWDVAGLRAEAVDRALDDLLEPGVATALVERTRPAVVVHLAWAASGTPGYRHSPDNDRWVRATLELVRACDAAGAALVVTGTSLDKELAPADAYAASKVRLWNELGPAVGAGALTWVRPYYVIDPERRRPALVEAALTAQEQGSPVVLRTPDSAHDFIHAADVGSAIVLAVREELRGELPIGCGRLRRVCDLVAALGIPWESGADPAAAPESHLEEVADSRRLRERGWTPARTDALFGDG